MMDYDLAIVGSGGGAFGAAIEARRADARVVVIERGTVGGTCVNIGCIPSKTLLAAAKTFHSAAAHPFAGLPTRTGTVDLEELIGQKDALVADMRKHKYVDLAGVYGFDIIHGDVRFKDPASLTVDGAELRAANYLLATGAQPAIPALPGLADADYLTSTTAMARTTLPKRLVTIGGGFVGLEQSQLFARLGSRVTVVGRLAPRAEPELASRLRRIFVDDGIEVVNARATSVERHGQMHVVHTDRGGTVDGDAVLVATGRHARVDGLDLETAGVQLDDRGFVAIDDTLRTSNPRVFAAGDVTGGPQFVYVAATQGRLAANNALRDEHDTVDYTGLPDVVFTDPQLARAGMTEAEAIAAGYDCDCRTIGFDNVPRGLVNHDTRGAIKLIADRRTGAVLGVSALAEGAGDLIQAAVYAIKFGLTVDQLANTWAPYLTTSEALRLVAQSFTRDVAHLSCCAA